MARHARDYAGERRTAKTTLQLTPSEKDELKAAAVAQGATLSDFTRELLFRRAAAVVASTRRHPEAAGLIKALHDLGNAVSANGNNLNQIARHLNMNGELRDTDPELLAFALKQHAEAADHIKQTVARVLDL